MDADFVAYLSKRGTTQDEYLGGTFADQAIVIAAFEKSKEGNQFHKTVVTFVLLSRLDLLPTIFSSQFPNNIESLKT